GGNGVETTSFLPGERGAGGPVDGGKSALDVVSGCGKIGRNGSGLSRRPVMEIQMSQKTRAKKHRNNRSKVATLASYGTPQHVEFMSIVVHRGSRIVEAMVLVTKNFETLDELTDELIGFATKHRVQQILTVDRVVPVELTEDGNLLLRIAD